MPGDLSALKGNEAFFVSDEYLLPAIEDDTLLRKHIRTSIIPAEDNSLAQRSKRMDGQIPRMKIRKSRTLLDESES